MQTDAREELRSQGYSLLPAEGLVLDAESRQHAKELAAEWDNLETDRYLKGGSRFRERRYDRFLYLPRAEEVRLRPHRPYFQSMGANDYAGGIDREVAPLSRTTLDNPLLTRLLRANFEKFPVGADDARLDDPWDVQCHQFRIISTPDETGEPTPEGPHRDEVDFGAIHLMGRFNADGGESQVYDLDRRLVTEFTLTAPMDTMFWADAQILHAVRPIFPQDPSKAAVRDVLIMGYRHAPELRGSDELRDAAVLGGPTG
ncbi:2OG-Fe dioxygenase family protein [Streptomyces sp. NPDC087917]|uniref:2OG-Fe dioxygenase family protein n=1 Tax=unclassified Streptomyces TaxID=2593676 RepID=UPI00341E14C3